MSSTRHWPILGGRATVLLALVLFAGIYALRESDPNVGDAEGILYVVPIAVLALRFGLRGGLRARCWLRLVLAWVTTTMCT